MKKEANGNMMKQKKNILKKIKSKSKTTVKDEYLRFRKINTIYIWTCFIILFLASDQIRTFYHESAHQAIFNMAGIESHTGMEFNWPGILTYYVEPNNQTLAQERCEELCAQLQEQNEIFTYNQSALFYTLWVLFGLFLVNKQLTERNIDRYLK